MSSLRSTVEGDIFEGHDENGRKVYLTQEEEVKKYIHVTGKLNDTDLISLGITLESAFSYSSFDKSGLYDPSFLELRKDYLFRGDFYHDMTSIGNSPFYD